MARTDGRGRGIEEYLMASRISPQHRRLAAVLAFILPVAIALIVQPGPSSADVTTVSGSALGYYSDVSLFGGAAQREGAGQVVCTTAPSGGNPGVPLDCFVIPPGATAETSASPSVVLPSTGGNVSDTKDAGAIAQYGPAKLFSGQYPNLANDPAQTQPSPRSGPLSAS